MKSNVRTRLKTGDEVVVIAGRDVGKTGTITSIKKNKALFFLMLVILSLIHI